ncbi:DUF11 domain-containing protein, partial [Fusobacterium sp. IOR10]|uniref:DUF11 domain-containing protein n=1 Tax=Fusobacterium sp. IOR10 TaxID=2665157 RepID=UPI0013D5F5D6
MENNSSIDTIKGLKAENNWGNILTDILNEDGTVEANQEAFDYSNVSITAVVSGIDSSYGDIGQEGNLENIILGPNGVIEYTIIVSTKERAIGEIGTIGTSGEKLVKVYEALRNNNEKLVNALNKLSPKEPDITIIKEKTNTGKYLPGDEIEYNITITNNGEGYAYGYTLSDDLSIITTDLANDSTGSIDDSSDITLGSAFDSAIITLTEKGDNSGSSNYTEGNSQNTLNLNDDIYIGPGETLAYTIIGKVNESAIGKIDNQVSFTNGTDVNDSSIISMDPEDLNVSDITIEKTVGVTQYEPDTDVVYTIKVKNNADDKFVNNYNIIDNISDILTTQADGTQGQAFSNWTLNVVSPTTSTNGTKVGTNIAGSQITDNINLTVDMAPGEEIIYELVAHVSVTSVGDILDNTSSGLDNVMESGNGIKSFPSQIAIRKTVDKTQYSPNEVLTYNIIIENKGKGYDVEVNIKDLLSSIKDKDGAGINNAFKSWNITSSFEGIDTNITPSGDSGLITEPLVDEDLNTTARIGAATRLIYTVQATVSGEACGKIKNIATINDELYSDKGSFAIDPDINVSISSDYPSYPKTGEDLESPFDITYTVKISNDSEAGFAKGVKIEDALSNVSTTALDGSTISNLFESWDISTNVYGDGTVLTSSSAYPLTSTTTDIDDTANITAGGYVEYIIKAKAKRDPSMDIIPYENIINTVTVTPKDKNEVIMSPINVSYTTSKKLPALRIEKSTSNLSYTLGGTVEYLLKVENIGEGYADNATISDELSNNFSEWTIEEEVPSPFVGTDADVNGNISNNTDINGTIDIAPGEIITYKITGTVKSLLSGETITNIGTVTDTQRGNTYKASAKLMLADPTGIYITKNASQYSYSPGGEINYTVTLYNTTSLPLDFGVLGYEFRDKFSEIDANLANDMGGTIADTTGSPFKKLFVSVNGGSETEITAEADYVHQPSLLAGIVESGNLIKPSEYTYKFRGILKDRVLSGEIKNEAVIEKTDGTQIAITSHEIDGSNSGSYTRNVDKSLYIPGEELTYTFTAKGNNGYLNNYSVNEDVKNIQVELLDGTTGNPFSIDDGEPQFTVERYVNGVLDGTSNSNGTVTSPVSDNENIVQTIDVSPEDTIIYKVKGTIRKDIVGAINFNGLVTEPYRHNLSIETTVEEGGYIPGEEITLKTTIENNSNGNAGNIDLQDLIDSLELELSDGTTGKLFPNGWTITAEKSGDNSQYINAGTYTDLSDINTEIGIPIGGKLIYKITGKVNELAVGATVNKVILDGDTVSANVQSLSSNLTVKKEVVSYYRNNGTSEVNGGYVPNGWIKYKITINNIGKGIADDIAVSDTLASIKTTAYDDDGSTKEINAFSEWEILSCEKTGTDSQSNINLTSGTEALGSTSLGWEMDIPSMGSVTINILAHVDEGAIGDIKNTVSVDGKDYSSETSKSLVGKAVLTKKAYEEDGVTSKSRYISGEKIVYKVIVKNTGEGIISGTIKDGISSILSLVEETGSNGNNPKEASFDSFTITASKTSSNDIDNITKIGTFELNSTKENIDIDDVLIIAPGATVEFEITGITKENIMGNIVNKVTFGNISKSVTVREKSSNISLDKKVIKVGDTTIPEGTDPINYDPGDTVEYEITITNTGYGHKNNLVLNENIDEIQAKIAGNTLSEAFENYSFEVIDSGNSYIRQVGLKTVIDMDPGKENAPEVVTIKVTGKLKDNIIGEIDENIVTYNNIIAKSEKLQQKTPEITYYKSFTDSLKNEIPNKENFAPEETLFYKLVIKNTGEGYANDLSVIDKIYDLKTSQNDKAFQDGEVTVTTKIYNGTSSLEGTNDGKTYVTGDTSGSSLINTTIDLAPNSTVEFYIAGKTTAYAIGSITNKILVEGEGNPTIESGKSDSVTTESIPSDIVGRKIAGTDPNTTDVYYTPGGDISYTLTFENNGDGPGIIYIKDIVSNLKVTGPGGEEINAFQSDYKFVLKTESGDVYCPSSSIELLSGEKIITGDLDTDIRLGENSSCSFTLTGKANVKAVGSIKNIATYNINSPAGTEVTISDTIEPTPGVVEITNVADGDIIASGEQATYTPGEQATYTLTIKNTGDGYAQNVNVEDLLSTMTGEASGDGSLEAVFQSIDSVSTTIGDNSASIGTGTTTNGYQGNFDIAPGESIVITLTGTVNDNMLGEIINNPVVTYNEEELLAPVSLTTVLPELNIVTKISTDGSIYSENSVNYIPGEKLYYEVTLSNIGKGWDNDVKLSNLINEIKATNSDTSVGTESLAFDESSIIITLESGDNVVFDSSAHNIDATMDIAPGESIIFKIEGIVNSDIIGEIKLDSKYENSKGTITTETSNEVVATQGIGEVSIEEKIKDPNTGVFNLDESNYIPGENVTFKVFIKNTADTFAQNIEINNLLTNMEVTLADGSQGDAFSEWEIMQEGPLKSESVLTNIFTNGNDLKSEGNLAPNDEYAFIITAKVNENAVGTIENKSLLTVNGIVKDPSNTIIFTPNENEIEMIKSTDSTTYYPNGEMVYKVVIENTGNSIINDIVFEDAINSEQVLLGDGNNGDPFNSTTVQGEVVSGETTITTTHPNVSADSTTGKVTSTSFDIKIGEKITFQITATVNNNVVGDIKNVATYTVDGGTPVSSNQVTTISEESEIVLTKVVEEPTSNEYIPGEKIKYKITIENTGKGFGDNINIVDEISKIMVDTVNGSAVAFSENDWEWTKETEELPNVIPDLTSFTGKDLDIDVDIESGKTLTLYVEGTVNSQAYGDISNTVTGKNGEDDIPESTVNISSSLGKVEITNTADVGSYTPGEPVTYILTVTNNGDGYAQNVNVEDLLSTMTGEISGDGSPLGLVFKSIDTVNTTIGDNSASIGTPSTSNGYEGNFNIAPGESIVITLTGTVNDNILGEIVNDPVVTYNGTKLKDPVSLETVLPKLNIVTRISEYGHVYSETPVNYIPGETLYYEVTLSNTGEGWDNNVKLSNLINEIKADASDGTESLAFKESTIIITLESGNNVVFDSSDYNLDATMDIAPGEDIIFKIEGVVNDNITGTITLDSKYENSKGTITSKTSNEVLATQKNEGLSVTERIKNPDTGEFDLFESSYVPGEDVIFKVFIENPEDTFAQNIDINNYLKSMKVELADGSDGDAFSSWTIVQSEFPTNNNSVITNTITNDNNLKSTGNLASKDKYSFIITAKVNENAVGEIKNNSTYTLGAGSENYSNLIAFKPEENKIEITKTAETETYYPNGEMVYNVVIENTGNSIINDISFEDDVNKEQVLLADGTDGDPFDSTTVTGEV